MRYAFLFLILIISASGCISNEIPVKPLTEGAENNNVTLNATEQNATVQTEAIAEVTFDKDKPPLLLKSIGINIDFYDPATGRAGDLVFTRDKLQFGVLFTEYGFTIPASMSATGQNKRNPQPTFILPMGTKVRSIVDGIVVGVPVLYSGDYSIQVASDTNSQWRYETEHVTNPLVKAGDIVKAGQIIAEVSPHSKESNAGYGLVEIGILKGGNPPQHICPFAYLDPSVKNEIQNKLLAFYKSWEEYRGDMNLYDEANQEVSGCLTLDFIEG